MANGQIPAYITELGIPNKTKNHIDISVVKPNSVTSPEIKRTHNDKTSPEIVAITKARYWDKYFGIKMIPDR